MADIMRLLVISKSTFYWFQNKYIFGTINKVYKLYQDRILSHVDKNSVRLGGDGRHDSPGHNAKYCAYSVMEQTLSEILHFHVSHIAETDGNSNLMEKQGLIKVLEKLSIRGVAIKSLTTDRHGQIRKYMREHSKIRHQFDIWYAAKSLRSKLRKAAKAKANETLNPWIKSIVNHFWWWCLTCKGNLVLLKEKCLSLLFHISNFHEFPENTIFKRCEHGDIDRQWLEPTSAPYIALKKNCDRKAIPMRHALLYGFLAHW